MFGVQYLAQGHFGMQNRDQTTDLLASALPPQPHPPLSHQDKHHHPLSRTQWIRPHREIQDPPQLEQAPQFSSTPPNQSRPMVAHIESGGFSLQSSVLVIAGTKRALSHEGCLLQHLHIASCCLMPLHNLELHCSIEGKSTPDHEGAPSTVPRRKHLRWHLLVMPVTLEAIRTIKDSDSSLPLNNRSLCCVGVTVIVHDKVHH
ncbi:unnamed protein product [Pleuronectes platessa]|uniref:Uncharacterized protein n=1 Tax=Pleuronectes platessa TaxID=8262 RepID=A0A9N7Z9H5_PLEPL|nr:unnamed protein product [Pleuronectes platessa]